MFIKHLIENWPKTREKMFYCAVLKCLQFSIGNNHIMNYFLLKKKKKHTVLTIHRSQCSLSCGDFSGKLFIYKV